MRARRREFALWICIFLAVDVGLDLGKKAVESLGGGDRSLERGSLPESYNVLRRIFETNTVNGAVRAQQLHLRSCKVSFKAGDINLFSSSWRHPKLLYSFGDTRRRVPGTVWEDCHFRGSSGTLLRDHQFV
jgi:hypothetical protein